MLRDPSIYVHEKALCESDKIGPRTRVWAFAHVMKGAKVGADCNIGDHVFMFASDYPHPETIFPDHADTVIAWQRELGEATTQKLMWENATRFLRLTSTPWSGRPS